MRRAANLPYRPPPSPLVVGQQLVSWHRDGGVAAAKAGGAAELRITLNLWGQLRRRLDVSAFRRDVVGAFRAILLDDGIGPAGRGAVDVTLPHGVPTDQEIFADRGQGEPQLVVDVCLKLKGDECLQQAVKRANVIARLMGEATGVDSVDCAVSAVADASDAQTVAKPPGGGQDVGQASSAGSTARTADPPSVPLAASPLPRAPRPTRHLVPTINGQEVSKDVARRREQEYALGDSMAFVQYKWASK